MEMKHDPSIDLWAMDEVSFQQCGSRCHMWIPPEECDPVVFHHPTRKSVRYYGAVRLRDGRFVYRRELDKLNGETCHSFLKFLRKVNARTSRQVVVIADNARYHHAKLHKPWREACQDRFALDFLPPYSPELNPAERIWKLVRRLCTHNRYFPALEDVILSVETQFDQWVKGSEILHSLCAIT